MKIGKRFIYKGKKYVLAGFGDVTMKKYPIKRSGKGEYIIFNGKREYLD